MAPVPGTGSGADQPGQAGPGGPSTGEGMRPPPTTSAPICTNQRGSSVTTSAITRPPSPARRTSSRQGRPGTPAAFGERLVSRLRAAAPDWTFQSEPLELKRDEWHRNFIGPLVASVIVAAFLLIMVALGLTGVLWLNVTQRTQEIGLRRAKGATILDVQWQIVGEVAEGLGCGSWCVGRLRVSLFGVSPLGR